MKYKDKLRSFMRKLNASVARKLHAAGIIIEGNTKRVITEKGIVDTGRLRSSVSWALDDGTSGNFGDDAAIDAPPRKPNTRTVRVGTNVEYAPHHEFGTTKLRARPYLRPGFEMSKQQILDLFNGVN